MTAETGNTWAAPWWEHERPWVVGVDGSDAARTALRWAVVHAPGRATSLRVLSAWQAPVFTPAVYGGPVGIPVELDHFEETAQAEVEQIAATVRAEIDVPVDGLSVQGGASSVLLDASAHAALLVVGTRGRGGFSRLLLGSTSSQCATHAEVPTVVVHEAWDGDPSGTILVGLDGSPNSLTALDWALRFAGPDSTVRVMWVWDTTPLAVGADEFFFPDAGEAAERRFHHLIDHVLAQREVGGISVERAFRRGRPREDLAMAAEEADLVVVGARGHGAVGAALLGSVSSWLLHRLQRPLVVVPHADEAGTVRDVSTDTEAGAAA
jgi:nucleotide-binding universal stress UspA family protein